MGAGNSGYFFEHVLTREAAYRALLGKNRRTLHSLAADALDNLLRPGAADEWHLLPHLIEHLAQAGRHLEAHRRCCELLYLAAGTGQHEHFDRYESEARTQLLLARPEAGPDQTSAALELARGERIYLRFEYIAARLVLEKARELAMASNDTPVLMRILRRLGSLAMQRGEHDLSAELGLLSLKLAEDLHAPAEVSSAQSLLGMLEMRYRRNYTAAEQWYRQALENARLGGSLRAETVALNNYGILLNENLGAAHQAVECWERALAINRSTDNRIGEAINADNLGGLYLSLGRLAEAAALLRSSVQRYGEVEDIPGVGSAGAKLGLAFLRMGELDAARRELETSLAILEPLDEDYWRGFTLAYLGSLAIEEGDIAESRMWFERCLALAQKLAEPQLLHEAAIGLAECDLAAGRLGSAAMQLATADEAADASGNSIGLAAALLLRAELLLAEAAGRDGDEEAVALELAAQTANQAEIMLAGLQLPAEARPMRHLSDLRARLGTPS